MRDGERMAASGGGLGLWFLPPHTVSAEPASIYPDAGALSHFIDC